MADLTPTSLLDWLVGKQFLTPTQAETMRQPGWANAHALVRELVRRSWLTPYQANQLMQGNADALVLGPYRLQERLGEGAMGQVVKARHVNLNRLVALKIFRKDLLANAKARERFRREVLTAAQLNHANIVAAHDADEIGDCHFLAMEFIEGVDLSRLVKQTGPLPIHRACAYIRQAALGLQHAFTQGIVHRDIKPGNLMVIGDGQAADDSPKAQASPRPAPLIKILDFGLARLDEAVEQVSRLTQVGGILGTVDYIAPEQAENARNADVRSDIYSLGCTLYYALTGEAPFPGDNVVERVSARLMGEPPAVRQKRPEVPPALEAVLLRTMARDPAQRYQTPAEVAAALEPFTRPLPAAWRPPVPLAQPAPPPLARPAVPAPGNIPLASPVAATAEPRSETLSGLGDMTSAPAAAGPARRRAAPKRFPVFLVAGGGVALLLLVFLLIMLLTRSSGDHGYPPGSALRLSLFPADSVSLKPGKNKDIDVKIERVKFKGPVKITVQGLPDGVRASDPEIKEDKVSVLMKLLASYSIPAGEAKVRVIATAKNLKAECALQITVLEDVAQVPAPADDPLLNLKRALTSVEEKARHTAVMDLIEMGPEKARPALPQLLTCLARPDNPRPLRENLLSLIKELLQPDNQNALPVLRSAVQDSDPLIRRQAALALLKLGDAGITTALPALRELLRADDPGDRRVAVVGLRKMTAERGAPSVLASVLPELLNISATDEEEEVRYQAQSVVDRVARNSKKGLMSLVEILANPKNKEDLRLQAATALTRQNRARLSEVRELRERLQAIAADADAPQPIREAVRNLVKMIGK